ncbi:MAG: diguanylate cyclase [Candidatus Hydrogenedentes bacterium]|nr:diguanylate cyclase [Candidatus Hydrogenedentota bacterium]
MGRQHKIVIISHNEEERRELQAMLESAGHSVEGRDAPPDLMVQREEPDVDLYVVGLPADFQPAPHEPGSIARVSRRRVLYVTNNASGSMRRELFRAGAAGVLTHPVEKIDLQYRAEQVLAANWNRFRREFDEPAMLKFLKEILETRIEVIEPSLDPQMPTGHFYPAVAKILGRTAMDRECLEKLAGLGLLGREVANRVRLCPECDDSRLNYRETCPKCSSLNILQQEMVTHFACAHSAPLQHFRRGSGLVCPKCNQALLHIGVDYEKPSRLFTCFSCEFVFRDPAVEAQCLRCNCISTPSQTIELTIYRFIVTPLAEQAVLEGQISGVNLDMLLRNTQTGLYSKPYFEHEIRRELVRAERYQSPFCMLLVRIDNFEEIASMHPSEATQFAESIFKAVSSGLRTLDTTCVWDIDTLGVLLSATDKARSKEVVRRIQENVRKLEFLYSIREPSVTISLVSSEDGHADADALTSAALTDLQE